MPLVGIVIGSRSDEPEVQGTLDALDQMGIEYELNAISAHRNPQRLMEYVKDAETRGIEVLIAAAGGSAALPGAISAWTTLPVIGIPLTSSELNGVDSLYAIAQMPPGVPVATVAIGSWGARNSAYLAASILSLRHQHVKEAYTAFRKQLRER